jgi:hypothetical protein
VRQAWRAIPREVESGEHEIILEAGGQRLRSEPRVSDKKRVFADDPVTGQPADFPVFAGFSSFRIA